MSKPGGKTMFVFLIMKDLIVQSAKLIKTQKTLDKYCLQYPVHQVRPFTSELEALKYIEENRFQFNPPAKSASDQAASSTATEFFETLQGQPKKPKVEKASNFNHSSILGAFDQDSQKDLPLTFDNSVFKFYTQKSSIVERVAKKVIKENSYFLFFDGASKFNPGPSGAGFAIFEQTKQIYDDSISTGFKTNNQAEYLGLIYGMRAAYHLGIKNINIFGDSQLIINQMTGIYKVKNPNIVKYHAEAIKLQQTFKKINFKYIPRESNQVADSLASKAAKKFQPKSLGSNTGLDGSDIEGNATNSTNSGSDNQNNI